MNPSVGTFITQDVYQGSIFEPLTLHKYLYAHANPVMNSDPSGYMALGNMAFSTAQSANMQAVNSSVYVNIFFSLKSTINTAVATYGIKNILAVTMIPFAIFLGGQMSRVFSLTCIVGSLTDSPDSPLQDYAASFIFATSAFLLGVQAIAQSNTKTYKNKSAIHHIVPKLLIWATPSRIVLQNVGIGLFPTNYRTAYKNKNIDTCNLVSVSTKLHVALHSNNKLYCAWVNLCILPSYFISIDYGYNTIQQNAVIRTKLGSMKKGIEDIDKLI